MGKTVGRYGGTNAASNVAPPYAKLTVQKESCVVFDNQVIYPVRTIGRRMYSQGKAGLPRGLSMLG